MLFLKLRYQQLRKEIIRGWYEVPYLYFTLGLLGVGFCGVMYKVTNMDDKDYFYTRHKHNYIVLRPNDVRLERYPRKYITDIGVLENYEKSKQQQEQK